jgi:hypothetical protein
LLPLFSEEAALSICLLPLLFPEGGCEVTKGVETAVRNSTTDMVLGNTLSTSPKQVTSQPPSGKSSGRRQIERAASSEKRGSNPVSRVSSNTSNF